MPYPPEDMEPYREEFGDMPPPIEAEPVDPFTSEEELSEPLPEPPPPRDDLEIEALEPPVFPDAPGGPWGEPSSPDEEGGSASDANAGEFGGVGGLGHEAPPQE
jgi:hypothetical protein